MKPLFSIITVTYNAEATVGRTLDSVAEQTYRQYEHIIMDGASADRTIDIVNERATDLALIQSKPDRGLYYAMNDAMSHSQGQYLIFLNAGDKFHSPTTLQTIAETIVANGYPDIVYGQTDIVDADGRFVAHRHLTAPESLTLDSFKEGMMVCHQAFIPKRGIAGYFNHRYRYSADYEWCIICLQHSHKNTIVPGVLIDYLNEGQTTRHHRRSLWERFCIMCHYYGTLPTIGRHFKFFFRNLRRNS